MKYFTLLVAFIASSLSTLSAQEISLSGEWEIIYDAANEGVENKWYLDDNFSRHDSIESIAVPSCIEEFKEDYEGVVFYRTKFDLPAAWQGEILMLNFAASNYKTEVWLNDNVVGFHEGGYTPFSFRLDQLARCGAQNTLVVRVVTPIILTDQRIDGIGRQETPTWRGAIAGGIWQDVTISSSGTLVLEDIFVESFVESGSLRFNCDVENIEPRCTDATLSISLYSAEGDLVAKDSKSWSAQPGGESLTKEIAIDNARLWELDSPYLYNCEVELYIGDKLSDSWSQKVGIREFTVDGDRFLFNGKPFYLKASFFEGLYPVRLAYPDSREMAIREIELAKAAGFNMIRPWRKPAPQMWLDLCDSMGMLTIGSLALECMLRPVSTPYLPSMVENELRQTILSNRNRTCIVQWELFNEINRPILEQMLTSMSLLARELDPSRMILDESGGFGRGANVYLPYERVPVPFNDIHHYSGSQVNQKEFDGYLAIAQSADKIKAMNLLTKRGFGRNIVKGKMAYVSELGYGSSPDIAANVERFRSEGNPITAPAQYHEELYRQSVEVLQFTGFDKFFDGVDGFCQAQQKMHGIANKRMIEAARSNDLVGGYCVHALTDGDWVLGAGLLDLWRNPKGDLYELTKKANGELITPIRIMPRNAYASRGTTIEVTCISEYDDQMGSVSLVVKNKKGRKILSEKFEMELKQGISTLYNKELNTSKLSGEYFVDVSIRAKSGELIYADQQSFDVFNDDTNDFADLTVAIVDSGSLLADFLISRGVEVVEFRSDLPISIPVVLGEADLKNDNYMAQAREAVAFAEAGGDLLFLEVPSAIFPTFGRELKGVSQESLPFGASLLSPWATLGGWAARTHVAMEHPIFEGLPTGVIMGGVYENIHPKNAMLLQEGNSIATLVGYDHYPNQDDWVRHYNGIGDVFWATDVVEVERGRGRMVLSTMDILSNLGSDPAADLLLCNMLNYILK